jgi:hypothetical protein
MFWCYWAALWLLRESAIYLFRGLPDVNLFGKCSFKSASRGSIQHGRKLVLLDDTNNHQLNFFAGLLRSGFWTSAVAARVFHLF